MRLLTVLFGLALASLVLGEDAKRVVTLPQKDLLPFLQDYCIECHGPDRQKGQVRLDEYSWTISDPDQAQRWQDVLDQLNGGDMPPEKADQPTDSELATFQESLSDAMLAARKVLTDHGGEIKMRRLNRREYAATMYDLFGLKITESELPDDRESHTFDTVGKEQFLTSVDFKEYLAFSRTFLPNALKWSAKPHWSAKSHHKDYGVGQRKRGEEVVAKYEMRLQGLRDGKPLKELGFSDAGSAQQYRQQSWIYLGGPKKYLTLPNLDQGAYFTGLVFNGSNYWNMLDPRGEYIFRFHGGVVGRPDLTRQHLAINDRGNPSTTVRMYGTIDKPETVEVRFQIGRMGRDAQKIHFREHYHLGNNDFHRRAINSEDPLKMEPAWASLWIDWMKMDGPYYPDTPPKITRLLYPDGVITKELPAALTDATAAKSFIENFATEVFRRQTVEPEYIAALYEIFQNQITEGKTVVEALTEPLAIILSSPKFLYLTEYPEGDSIDLTERELAVRLAYFLWSCPPDEELYAAKLSNRAVLASQVDRMLADKRARALSDGFVAQWAEFDRFDAISIDPKLYPKFNSNMRLAAKQEAREFFHTLVSENLPASNLIDSDFVMVNGILADHYGLDGFNSKNGEFVKMPLPPGSPRGGMMTQAHFLVSGSNGERSSPVIRGAMVMEKLLHDKPPPPPPNVPELDEASDTPKTNREMVLLHQNRASCASCHKKIDVIGFGLENFDQTGAWRTHESVDGKQVLIEPGGTLPDGTGFADVMELKKALLGRQDALAKELTSSMLTYALGRTMSFADQDDIDEILMNLDEGDYPVGDLVKEIACSKLFRTR
ncbi:MAG: DUF1592 domain-containing protein [Verrucomicrobiota bacterium]